MGSDGCLLRGMWRSRVGLTELRAFPEVRYAHDLSSLTERRLRIQTDVVAQASQRREEARVMLAQMKSSREQLANYKKRQEDSLEQTQDPDRRKWIETQIESLKNQLEELESQQPEAQAQEAECANQLRLEQEGLGQLQDQVDRLDRKLEYALRQPAESPQVSARPKRFV